MFQLIQDDLYPRSATYNGYVEECTFTFSLGPEQLPGTGWLLDKALSAFENKVAEQGCEMIKLQVYEDTAPFWTTDYRVVATATASPIFWSIVVVGVLAILFLLTLAYVINSIRVFFWGTPGNGDGGGGLSSGIIGMMVTMMIVVMMIGMMTNMMGPSSRAPQRTSG